MVSSDCNDEDQTYTVQAQAERIAALDAIARTIVAFDERERWYGDWGFSDDEAAELAKMARAALGLPPKPKQPWEEEEETQQAQQSPSVP